MVMYKKLNGVTVELTSAEEQEVLADREQSRLERPANQLREIRMLRNQKLQETDYMANSDVTMPSYIKTWRQTLRDLPQNNTTESQYNTLLERNADGSLKNSVWTQPTE